MDFFKKTLLQVQEHFQTLNASQKLVYILLLVLIGISAVWTVVWTSEPELIPLLDQSFSESQIANIENRLDLWDVKYKVENGRLMVKRQDQNRLLARLQLARALPSDVSEGWKKLITESDMWMPSEDRQRRWQLAQEQRLAQIIQLMDGVNQAHVIINTGSKKILSGGPSSDPSASVYLQMQSGVKPSKRIIESVADLVSGTVDRLLRERVRIVANGTPYRVAGTDSPFTADVLDARREFEKHFGEKIHQILGIQNALVGVFVELETDTIQTEEQKFGEPSVSRERMKEDTSEESEPSGEPGVRPNTGISVPSPTEPKQKSSKSETETEYDGKRDITTIRKRHLAGTVKNIRASINIPHSYFKMIYKKQAGKDKEPTESDLKSLIASQLEDIRKKVMPIINVTDPKFVEVSWYYDNIPAESTVALAGSSEMTVPGLVQYAKPAGLIVLAFSSLLMVLLMLKKASVSHLSVPDSGDSPSSSTDPLPLDTGNAPVGEAGSSEGVLQGIEIDEDALRSRTMSEQVSTLVKEDPTAAAALVKQWINKD